MKKPIIETLELLDPIQVDESETVAKLEFTGLTAGDMEEVTPNFTFGSSIKLANSSTGVPLTVLKQLSARDTIRVFGVISGFFGAGQATGSK